MNCEWRLKQRAPSEFISQFPQYSSLVLHLLYNRGLRSQAQIDEFFNPDYEQDLHDPFLMKGVKEAVQRIEKAILKNEKIAIFGDYDVDGVCASLVLKSALENLEATVSDIYIPDRATEGYGLNEKALRELAGRGIKLIITVDCGISNHQEVKLAKSLGMEVIITDHHRVIKDLPKTKIIIDPHQPGDNYPFKNLSGTGVAFKLAQALIYKLAKGGKNNKNNEAFIKWLLDLVALATVGDAMPLLGENRTLVKYGLIVLGKSQRIGLRKLIKKSGISEKQLDTYDLSFILVPRLNAAGRMDHANMAYWLLSTRLEEEADILAERLNQINQERQRLVEKIVSQLEKRLKSEQLLASFDREKKFPKIIFEGDVDWSPALLGLVAGKICDKYHRPAIVFNLDKKQGKCQASARSIDKFNIVEAIGRCSKYLVKFGGHPGAAGFVFLNKKLIDLKKSLEDIAEKQLKEEDLRPVIDIDLEIKPEDFNWQLNDQIELFAPFGQANPKPIFLMTNLQISDFRIVGNNGKHLKMDLQSDGKIFKAIGFNFSEWAEKLKVGDKIDVVFEVIVDEWNGNRDLQMKIIDIKPSE